MTSVFLRGAAFTFKKRNVKMYSVLYMKIHWKGVVIHNEFV